MEPDQANTILAYNSFGLTDLAVPIAAGRAGAVGIVDLGFACEVDAALEAARTVAGGGRRWGIRLDASQGAAAGAILAGLRVPNPPQAAIRPHIVLSDIARAAPEVLDQSRANGACMLAEVISAGEIDAAMRAGADGVVLKGNEAGGRVGGVTSFILLQDALRQTKLPLWVHGGVGLHTAAACYAAGAAGVVLDHQLTLTSEAQPPEAVRAVIARMDGSETVCRTQRDGTMLRAYFQPGRTPAEGEQVGWGELETHLWPLGQDAAMAAQLAARFRTVGGVVEAMRVSIEHHVRAARLSRPLAAGSSMARSHGTRYPVVQGPMTRVSDNAAFARAVAEGGGLPFLALALMRASEIHRLLEDTRAQLGALPWGVGILGFVPDALRQEQLEVVRAFRPTYSLIAGGRPDQAAGLEREGIKTYLHVPSPGLLRQFLESGVRRFVFEGRECGGHVGPRSSFVLWNTMIDTALDALAPAQIAECHFLFAGGIHDGVSAAAVAAAAAPLAERGAKLGALLGTAYLFTHEAVKTGAIVPGFQEEAIRCTDTVLLETGPGHATRCARTAYAEEFQRKKESAKASPEEVRRTLEYLNLGRLRIASKGIRRVALDAGRAYESVDDRQQRVEGMYMIGQVAALRNSVCSIEELHREVCVRGTERLASVPEPRLSREPRTGGEQPCDIAIVGMACLLPKASGLDAYWNNILNKVDGITEIPASRWDWRRYYDADPKAPDKVYSKWGGFLDDVRFDPLRYGMPPNSLASIEPLQLLTLEVARAALEDAGYGTRPFPRERCSVILGAGGGMSDLGNRYAVRSSLPTIMDGIPGEVYGNLPQWTEDSFAGILLNVTAGRVANRFDLGGMNCTLDAACASSLGALYLAAKELETGTSDMVLAGGADTMQNPFAYLCFSKTHALSARGRCRTFDETADGIVISEGVAIVVLKRLGDAEADGDRIYAVLKGVGSSSDGQDKGLTAPRPEGQARALRRAYAKAGFSPATVGLIEAHGTGTAAGDLAEVEALTKVFTEAGAEPQACAIGSVKSMIGHTKCTAGVASLIKVALALHDKVLPPTLNVQQPNRKARFSEGPFYVNSDARPWMAPADGGPRRGGVSAFGFGGTNFHAVLEENADPGGGARYRPCEMFAWAAETQQDLLASIAKTERFLQAGCEANLGELAFAVWRNSASTLRRSPGALRLAVTATSVEDLANKVARVPDLVLAGFADSAGTYFTSKPLAPGQKVGLLFPGQGSQKPGMLADLAIRFHEVRRRFEIADCVLAGRLPQRLSTLVFPTPGFTPEESRAQEEALRDTRAAQPALGAAGLGCLRLLEAFGLTADCAAGHSYGEYVALCAAGAFDEQQLYRLSEARGRAIAENSTAGAMAAVNESAERVGALIGGLGEVWIASRNAPRQTVLSGSPVALEQAMALLERHGVSAQMLNVACAFHSPLVAAAAESLERIIRETPVQVLGMPVYSNQTGEPYPAEPDAVRAQLAAHLTQPVGFQDEVRAMWRDGVRVFVEAGPRGVLTGLADQVLAGDPHLSVCVGAELNHALGRLFAHHVPMSFDRWFRGRALRRIELRDASPPVASKALWLVNGGRVRALGSSDAPAEPVKVQAQGLTSVPVAGAPAVSLPGEMDQVMLRYQETMARMIEMQQQVMLAYLQGGHTETVLAAAPLMAAAAPEPEPLPEFKPAPAPVAPAPPAHVAEPLSIAGLTNKLLQLVSERTGYPPELLGLDQDMEADLGIDSIKRVEILGAFRKAVIPEGADGMERLAGLKTLRQVIETVSDTMRSATDAPAREALPRYAIALVETAALPIPEQLPGGTILITDDEGGIADSLASTIRERGGTPLVVRRDHLQDPGRGAITGIIHLLTLNSGAPFESLDSAGWRARLEDDVTSLFQLAHSAVPRPAFLLAATRIGGGACASHGGVAGLVKTIGAEWKDVRARVVDFSDEAADEIAVRMLAELASDDHETEIAYRQGQRSRLRLVPAPLEHRREIEIARGSVMLITGGARGITAQVTVELARRYRPKLILVGRTEIPAGDGARQEPDTTAEELRTAIIEETGRRGKVGRLADIEARVVEILRIREIRRNLARMEQAGAEVQYHATDVRDEAAFGRLLDSVYEKYGRIDYTIHGAGIIEDKRIEDKTGESFRRVLETKVMSAFVLSRKLRPESMKALVLFSSVAGRFGNAGQGDYAAANEVLNKLAGWLDQRWPCRVVALNWGPWDRTGMASPAVLEGFAARGIGVIAPEAGRAAFDRELRCGVKGEAEIVLGAVPAEPAGSRLPLLETEILSIAGDGSVECNYRLSADTLLFLNDHRLDGKPVLPAAAAAELMAELVQKAYPDWRVASLRSLRVLKGIVLDREETMLRLSARSQTQPSQEASELDVDVVIRDAASGMTHYRATARLGNGMPEPEQAPAIADVREYLLTAADAYREYLFHGPRMHCIESIDSVSGEGIAARLRHVPPSLCVAGGAGNWLLDPVMLDAGPQLAIVWSRLYLGATALPSAFAEYRRLADADELPLRCYLRVRPDSSETCVLADVYFVRADGRLAGVIDGLEATADRRLNRLAAVQRAAAAEVGH